MKSYGGLWEKVICEETLREAWRLFKKHHSTKIPVVRYDQGIDRHVAEIHRQLADGTWEPGNYRQFVVYEPKPRIISCASLPDRVVHHAFCLVVAPLMEKRFIDQSYACRKGKGSHLAVTRARELCARHPYFLKLDVRHYFASVDHDIMTGILRKMLRESPLRRLAEKIVRKPIPNPLSGQTGTVAGGKGLPIGNLTSQWFANLYLDGLDHFATERLQLGGRYLRYMDDLLIFCDTKEEAWMVRQEIGQWLAEERRLELKEAATVVAPVSEGVPFLGLRIWKNCWRLRHSRLKRTRRSARRHYKDLVSGKCTETAFQNVIRSMEGAVRWYGFKGILAPLDAEFATMGVDNGTGRHPAMTEACARRRIRGGNYNNDATNCSSWYRGQNTVGNTNDNIGFRLSSTCAIAQKTQITEDILHKSHPGSPAPRVCGDEHATAQSGPVDGLPPKARISRHFSEPSITNSKTKGICP